VEHYKGTVCLFIYYLHDIYKYEIILTSVAG